MQNQPLNCLIIDDEAPARHLLKLYVSKIPNLHLGAVCESAVEALPLIANQSFNLAFIDIQMPDLTGIDFMAIAKDKIDAVIFTTAYKEYAIKGYELGIIDYLLKPFSFERFVLAVEKGRELHQLKNSQTRAPISPIEPDSNQTFFVKSGQKLIKVDKSSIAFIEGMKEYLAIHTLADQRILTYYRMKNMEEVLTKSAFVRIHKSFIVNKNHVDEIDGNQLKIINKWLPVGGNYKTVLKDFDNLII
ncbi:MAG: LytR/AlgR family response regulator transcription factor [Bacteroidia bacterium]